MDLSTLSTVVNEKTNSTFYTIGHTENGLIGSIRVWAEKAATNQTAFLFRFRVEKAEGAPQIMNFEHFVKGTFPDAKWTSMEKDYSSVAGSMVINMPVWNIDGIMGVIAANKVFALVFTHLKQVFGNMHFIFDEAQFEDLMTTLTTNILTMGLADAKDAPAVVYKFGAYKAKLENTPDAGGGIAFEHKPTTPPTDTPQPAPAPVDEYQPQGSASLGLFKKKSAPADAAPVAAEPVDPNNGGAINVNQNYLYGIVQGVVPMQFVLVHNAHWMKNAALSNEHLSDYVNLPDGCDEISESAFLSSCTTYDELDDLLAKAGFVHSASLEKFVNGDFDHQSPGGDAMNQ